MNMRRLCEREREWALSHSFILPVNLKKESSKNFGIQMDQAPENFVLRSQGEGTHWEHRNLFDTVKWQKQMY